MSTVIDDLRHRLPAGCTARPLGLADVEATYEVYAAAQVADCGAVVLERADIVADWSRPSMDTGLDTVGVELDGRLVAAAEVGHGGGRAEVAVHPAARGLGIGTWVARWTEAHASARGVPGVGQSVPEGSAGERLLLGLGYRRDYTAWILGLPSGASVPERDLPPGYRVRSTGAEADARGAYTVVQRAFGEWSDRSHETFADWAAGTLRRPGFEPWQLRVVEHDDDGVVGVAFTVVDEMRCGYVDQLAVSREHRGRGLAQALLVDAFRNAAEHGAQRSELATDSRTGALDLYRRVGMVVTSTWQHLVVDLPRAAGAAALS